MTDFRACAVLEIWTLAAEREEEQVERLSVLEPPPLPSPPPPSVSGQGHTMSSTETVKVKVEFGGGTELLLAPPHEKKHNITLPRSDATGNLTNVTALIEYIRKNLITEREELFVDGDSV